MINNKILELTGELKNALDEQMKIANNALNDLPESETKNKLKELLRLSSKGKVNVKDAQREINKILNNAR